MNLSTRQPKLEMEPKPPSRVRVPVAAVLIALPPVLFYTLLFRMVLNIPFFDDYRSVLDFTNHLVQLKGFQVKTSYFAGAQLNEYKLLLQETAVWLQFSLFGRVDFRILSAVGNGFVLLLALILWKMFLPTCKDLGLRLTLFIPVSWLLFQFQYYELLNWGSATLQHVSVLVFAFATIYLLFRPTRRTFCGAVACFILAVASSGNGFLLLPIGLLILGAGRQYARIIAWLAASAGCLALYSYHYNVMSSQASPDHSIISALLRLRPIYVISFMGSAASIPFPVMSYLLGASLCFFFSWVAFRGFVRRNPQVSCCVLFLFLTAVGVAGIRSDLGLVQSMSSRYTIYSALLLIFAWFAIVEEFLKYDHRSLLNSGAYRCVVLASVLFSLLMDSVGFAVIKVWDARLIEGMAEFEHPNPPNSTKGPEIPLGEGDTEREAFNPIARAILLESIRLGVYRPPALEPGNVNEATAR